MIKILIYNQYFLLDISGVDHLRLSYLPYIIGLKVWLVCSPFDVMSQLLRFSISENWRSPLLFRGIFLCVGGEGKE